MGKSKKKSKKGSKILIVILLLAIAGVGAFLGYKYIQNNKTKEVSTPTAVNETEPVTEPEKTVQIYAGTERPIACMIDNHSDAWPQFSINKAYAVYEIIVEGGETRLMAVFNDIASVFSANVTSSVV